jgi:hypothetical protein
MVILDDILACRKTKELAFVEISVRKIFDIFYAGRGQGKSCLFDQPLQFVLLTTVSFCIYDQGDPFFESQ